MPRPKTNSIKKRLSIETTAAVRERMEILRDDTGAQSITELIARSFAVYEVLQKAKSEGSDILIRDKDGNESIVVIVP